MPNNQSVLDIKPKNLLANDLKPLNFSVSIPTQIYYLPTVTISISQGQWIPFAGLTYPQQITVILGGNVRP